MVGAGVGESGQWLELGEGHIYYHHVEPRLLGLLDHWVLNLCCMLKLSLGAL